MNLTDKPDIGYFEIAKEPSSLSFDTFWQRYAEPEQPFIIEGIASAWPAEACWNGRYLHEKLAEEPLAKEAFLWYWLQKGALAGDYETPAIVEKSIESSEVYPRTQVMRIWIHEKGNLSSWHYDANMVNVFNVQVTGRKKWYLIAPETPIDCYPFTNFGVLDGQGETIFRNKRYTEFTLKAGDLLFLPALWFHKVEACDEENISLNWVFTKKATRIITPAFKREYDRYFLAEYFLNHRYPIFRNLFNKLNNKLPNYLRVLWQDREMIRSPYRSSVFYLMRTFLREMAVLPSVVFNAKRIRPYLGAVKRVKRLNRGYKSHTDN